MITPSNTALFFSALLSALVAGLFYGYACSINPGLGKLSDPGYLSAMQSINREILNPLFFASFMGTLCALPLAAWLCYAASTQTSFYLLLGASVVYLLLVVSVTAAGNVPLNEALAGVDLERADAGELGRHRAAFEALWNRYHGIRTWGAVITFALTLLAIFKK